MADRVLVEGVLEHAHASPLVRVLRQHRRLRVRLLEIFIDGGRLVDRSAVLQDEDRRLAERVQTREGRIFVLVLRGDHLVLDLLLGQHDPDLPSER